MDGTPEVADVARGQRWRLVQVDVHVGGGGRRDVDVVLGREVFVLERPRPRRPRGLVPVGRRAHRDRRRGVGHEVVAVHEPDSGPVLERSERLHKVRV